MEIGGEEGMDGVHELLQMRTFHNFIELKEFCEDA